MITVAAAAEAAGLSARTVQRHIEAGRIKGAVLEPVPGGNNRWLLPIRVVDQLVAAEMIETLRFVALESTSAMTGAEAWKHAVATTPDPYVIQESKEASTRVLLGMIEASRVTNQWFGRVEGWDVTYAAAPLIHWLEKMSGAYQRALNADLPQGRLRALADLQRCVGQAIEAADRMVVVKAASE